MEARWLPPQLVVLPIGSSSCRLLSQFTQRRETSESYKHHAPTAVVAFFAVRANPLQPEIAQGWVVVGTTAEMPTILALAVLDWEVINAGDA
jgi:hypothetical protein